MNEEIEKILKEYGVDITIRMDQLIQAKIYHDNCYEVVWLYKNGKGDSVQLPKNKAIEFYIKLLEGIESY